MHMRSAEPVDVLFNAHITIAFLGHRVIFIDIVAHGLFKVIRHAVFIGILRCDPCNHFAPTVIGLNPHCAHALYQRTRLSKRIHLRPNQRINIVVRQHTALRRHVTPSRSRAHHRPRRRQFVPRFRKFLACTLVVVNARRFAIQNAIAILVNHVAAGINALVFVHLEPFIFARRPINEIVIYDIVIKMRACMGCVARLEIVEDIVYKDVVNLVQRIAIVGVDKSIVIPCPSAIHRFNMRTELLANGICNQRILHGNTRHAVIFVVGTSAKVIPGRKFHRAMIHNHVLSIVKVQTVIFFGGGIFTRPNAQIANDDVTLLAGTEFAAMNSDALAGSRLPRNRDITLDRNRRLDVDNATHIKNNNAVALAHRIAERTHTVIVQVRHVVNTAAATTGNICPEAQSLRKG